jgi:hypothetical protein
MARPKLTPLTEYRQSLLAGFETCARRTRFSLQVDGDYPTGWVESTGELGQAFHAVAAEMLRTMYRQGEVQMPTQEAVEIMREVYAAGDIVLPTEDRHTLRGLVLGFCAFEFVPTRIVALEERLTLDVPGPDGVLRTVKGQPDLIMLDPPDGLVIVDWKSGKGKPKKPRTPEEGQVVKEGDREIVYGKRYLSERGHFQLDTYGLLALKGRRDDGTMLMPDAQRVTLREIHLRSGEERVATLGLAELEHIEPDIGDHMMKLERAIAEGPKSPLWSPRPGSHCSRQCPVVRSCPIPREMRGQGAIATQAQADEAARQAAVLAGQREALIGTDGQLKAWEEAGNPPGRANDREEWRWDPPGAWVAKGGGRKFGLYPVANGNGNGAT